MSLFIVILETPSTPSTDYVSVCLCLYCISFHNICYIKACCFFNRFYCLCKHRWNITAHLSYTRAIRTICAVNNCNLIYALKRLSYLFCHLWKYLYKHFHHSCLTVLLISFCLLLHGFSFCYTFSFSCLSLCYTCLSNSVCFCLCLNCNRFCFCLCFNFLGLSSRLCLCNLTVLFCICICICFASQH